VRACLGQVINIDFSIGDDIPDAASESASPSKGECRVRWRFHVLTFVPPLYLTYFRSLPTRTTSLLVSWVLAPTRTLCACIVLELLCCPPPPPLRGSSPGGLLFPQQE
jgi:hypothetical protein